MALCAFSPLVQVFILLDESAQGGALSGLLFWAAGKLHLLQVGFSRNVDQVIQSGTVIVDVSGVGIGKAATLCIFEEEGEGSGRTGRRKAYGWRPL